MVHGFLKQVTAGKLPGECPYIRPTIGLFTRVCQAEIEATAHQKFAKPSMLVCFVGLL